MAKQYAHQNNTSLSSLVENFFKMLKPNTTEKSEFAYSPIVKELAGVISLSQDYDYKEDYINYLESKYE